ncbi:unnamed protein product [Chondrus crispus]|uniref:Uncharacterized protein n=1 Tax=Chondrus crispus TaxID=2769 RepID=R7Q2H2_CHOCR|nr:unnamed protein product [Chondrus crispus]CDF32249.1 unnamed protein product [Chondrus crispus]|eukprot:XP_005711914.1 unnamed protein product [Chondrus crispus]
MHLRLRDVPPPPPVRVEQGQRVIKSLHGGPVRFPLHFLQGRATDFALKRLESRGHGERGIWEFVNYCHSERFVGVDNLRECLVVGHVEHCF